MSIKGQAVTYTSHGKDLPNILQLTEYSIDPSKLKSEEILIELVSTPVNPSDLSQIFGGYTQAKTFESLGNVNNTHPPVHVGGNEGVYKIIKSSDPNFKTDDLVIPKLPGFGTWRSHAIVTSQDLINVQGLTVDQASTVSINPSTAYQIIHQFIQDWQSGDWILQNSGNSQVSKYVSQIGKLKGIKTLSIVRDGKSEEEVKSLKDIGATEVVFESEFTAKDFDIKKYVKEGENVRLALNGISNHTVKNLVSSLSQDGQLITYGVIGGSEIIYDSGVQLLRNIQTKAFWLTSNTKRNPLSKVETIQSLIKLYKDGQLKDVPFNRIHSTGNLRDSLVKAIEETKNGKQVVFYS